MSIIVKDLIKYEGVTSCTNLYGNSKNFKQTNIHGILCIPECKPDVEQIVKVWATINIDHYETIQTPVGLSEEGQQLTGRKMLVVGDIRTKVQYVANNDERNVHTAHFDIPFCEYIVLPEAFCLTSYLSPKVYIEDMYVNLANDRCFFYNYTLLFVAKMC